MATQTTQPTDLEMVRHARSSAWRRYAPIYLLMMPSLVLILMFFYYPAISGFFYSFTHWTIKGPIWAGLANYKRLVNDTRLIASVGNPAQIVLFNVIVVVTMPLMAAVFRLRMPSPRAQYVFRLIYVFPMVVRSGGSSASSSRSFGIRYGYSRY